jgi:serine/threonine-protein kinase RsbW
MVSIIRMTLSSTPRAVGRVEGFLRKVNKKTQLDEIQMHKLMVSLTEAVNNAIVHGNKSNPKKKVRVVCDCFPELLEFKITDEGRGFKPEKVKNPLHEENLLRTSGRGIFLMRTLMDKVEFEAKPKGSTVRLVLELKK